MTTVTTLLRYPLKAHGREVLDRVTLVAGQAMPFDRQWAVAHEASSTDGTAWAPCAHFSRAAKAPALMAITSALDETTGLLTLSHPDKPDLTFDPDHETEVFIAWVLPLVPKDRALPNRIVKLAGRGFTDSDFASVTLCNLKSHETVEQQMRRELSINRWRGNIWFDADTPWIEFDWVGRDVRIGGCVLTVRERTERCLATTANPDTGQRDADILAALEHWGHQDFSVLAEVKKSGTVNVGDRLEVL